MIADLVVVNPCVAFRRPSEEFGDVLQHRLLNVNERVAQLLLIFVHDKAHEVVVDVPAVAGDVEVRTPSGRRDG